MVGCKGFGWHGVGAVVFLVLMLLLFPDVRVITASLFDVIWFVSVLILLFDWMVCLT